MKAYKTILLSVFCTSSLFAQTGNKTYYYERVAIVKNGVKQTANGDGHYLTLNSRILYESEANGTSKGTSSVKYINSDNNMPFYEGNTILGRGLSYVFNSDYSRLNVREPNGIIYVYERKIRPTATSMMRTYESNEGGTYIATTEIQSSRQSSSKQKSSSTSITKRQKVTCTRCKGFRYIDKHVPIVGEYGIKKPEYYICNICNKRVAKNGGHGHDPCPSCHGTGFVYERIN